MNKVNDLVNKIKESELEKEKKKEESSKRKNNSPFLYKFLRNFFIILI